LKKIHLKDKH